MFDLFDLNDLNSLSVIDVEFMLNCCISSTYKLHSISTELSQEDLKKFVSDNFKDDSRINISQLIK